jgi:hypothetical protein
MKIKMQTTSPNVIHFLCHKRFQATSPNNETITVIAMCSFANIMGYPIFGICHNTCETISLGLRPAIGKKKINFD